MANQKVIAVVGIGPGLGRSIAVRFAREDFRVALMARGESHLSEVAEAVLGEGGEAFKIAADATDAAAVGQAFNRIRDEWGDVDVLVYNAGQFRPAGLLDMEPEVFEQSWRSNCMGAFLAAREVLPAMVNAGRGTVILTGATAAWRGGVRFSGLAVGKFGLRALAQSMAREFGPQGVHVAHTVIDGQIGTPRNRRAAPKRPTHEFLDPDAIAETYWQLHCQPNTAWTLELDLRPSVERF